MYIKKITLVGYKRLMLNSIRSLTIQLDNPYQIILGTNGSGKSSLLEELTPLPATPNHYLKGGRKSIEIDHRGHQYQLLSSFEGKPHHSFLCDGSELNTGGTITVQRELVYRHFEINDDILGILNGKVKFTQMTPAKRREWISRLSDNDMTYAMGIFKSIASKMRDYQGTLTHLNERIAKETHRLISLEVEQDIESKVDRLQTQLTHLMYELNPQLPEPKQIHLEIWKMKEEADEIMLDAMTYPYHKYKDTHQSLNDLLQDEDQCRQGLKENEIRLEHVTQEFTQLHNLVGSLEISGVESVQELEQKKAVLVKDIQVLQSTLRQFTLDGVVDNAHQQQQAIKAELIDILTHLPDNHDRRYSQTQLKAVEDDIIQLTGQRDKYTGKYQHFDHLIECMDEVKSHECPKCHHTWREGVSEQQREDYVQKRAQCTQLIKDAEAALERLYQIQNDIREYSVQYGRLRQIRYDIPAVGSFIDHLLENDRILNEPRQYIPLVDVWVRDLNTTHAIRLKERELGFVDEVLKKATLMGDLENTEIHTTLVKLEQSIESLTLQIRERREELDLLQKHVSAAKRMQKNADTLMGLMKQLHARYMNWADATVNTAIRQDIATHQSTLAELNRQLKEKEQIASILEDLTRSLVEVEEKHRIYKLLFKALSPTEGIIAEQLMAFIHCFVDQMNDILQQVYTYPIQIIPCGLESNELDYKFPITIGEGLIEANDVSDGSEGQQEIIDFAFKLVATLYLNLNEYPLYLDEVGRHQDETHISHLMGYIKLLIESQRHSQLFMISHQAPLFSAFNNAAVLVLNNANITVPARHNEHVEIQH